MDSDASDIGPFGPRKRKVPINDNGEEVIIPKVKKKKVAEPAPQPSARTSSTSKKNAKNRAAKSKPKTRKAPIKKPAPAVVSDEQVTDAEEPEPDAINVVTDSDASDDEPVIPEVPDVKTDEEELGL
jgi:hypothetical protein